VLPACTSGTPGSPDYIETGDLRALRRHGILRILMPPLEASRLPRHGYAIDLERELAEQLAAHLHLTPHLVTLPARDALLEALAEGRGDLVLARLTVTDERRERFSFSQPLDYTREVLVVRADDQSIGAARDLAGKSVAVRASSAHFGTLRDLRGDVPSLEIVTVPEEMDTEEILAQVADGRFDASVADEDLFEAVLEYRDDLRRAFALTEPRPIGWAMRAGSTELKSAVDRFLQEQALTGDQDEVLLGGLEEIRRRKVLRVLTRNNAATTYLYRGDQVGFEFELARQFARSLKCRIEVVIPPAFDDLIPWLLEGRGDLIAASMTATPDRAKRVAFTMPYLEAREMVVVRAGEKGVETPEDLVGRPITVRPASAYHDALLALEQQRGLHLTIDPAPEWRETEDLIAAVADGEYEVTVADSHILAIELSWRNDVRGAFEIGEPAGIAWAVRPRDHELLAAANRFLRHHTRGSTFFNILRRRYFTDREKISGRVRDRPRVSGRVSPYDDLFRKYGRQIGVDWRLLAAQAYQESRFDPDARSWAGAQGLMQILPRTGSGLGIKGDLHDPETGIRAGAQYLKRLTERYNPKLPIAERLRFALGAYNAGPGHIRDARRLARKKGLDPNIWAGNVERVLPLLARREYARQARYGYCRCREPVRYVREIQERYRRYIEVID
jgi:membrane-bound lytic murein transglycosylase F